MNKSKTWVFPLPYADFESDLKVTITDNGVESNFLGQSFKAETPLGEADFAEKVTREILCNYFEVVMNFLEPEDIRDAEGTPASFISLEPAYPIKEVKAFISQNI